MKLDVSIIFNPDTTFFINKYPIRNIVKIYEYMSRIMT